MARPPLGARRPQTAGAESSALCEGWRHGHRRSLCASNIPGMRDQEDRTVVASREPLQAYAKPTARRAGHLWVHAASCGGAANGGEESQSSACFAARLSELFGAPCGGGRHRRLCSCHHKRPGLVAVFGMLRLSEAEHPTCGRMCAKTRDAGKSTRRKDVSHLDAERGCDDGTGRGRCFCFTPACTLMNHVSISLGFTPQRNSENAPHVSHTHTPRRGGAARRDGGDLARESTAPLTGWSKES